MAWYDRIKRSVSGVISPKPWLINLFGGNATLAGENVSSTNAPKVSALYACGNLIGNTIASLPWQLFRETEQGLLFQPGLINDLVSKRPNEAYNSYDFRKAMLTQLLLRGNAYVLPVRSGNNLAGLELIDTELVTVDTTSGELIYQLHLRNGINLRLIT